MNLDTLGLTSGQTYAFDVFIAERRTPESTLRIQTFVDFDRNDVPERATLALPGLGLAGLGFSRRAGLSASRRIAETSATGRGRHF